MQQRMIEFVSGLRAAGVRVSIAESKDAFEATQFVGIRNRDIFRSSLRTTLVKEAKDQPIFEQLFPLYFGSDGPPLINLMDDLSPEERKLLEQALRAFLEQMAQDQNQSGDPQQGQGLFSPQDQLSNLMQLLQWLLQGQNPTQQDFDQLGQQVGLPNANRSYQQRRFEQRMMRQLGLQMLEQLMNALAEKLSDMGMSQQAIDQIMEGMRQNKEALAEQIATHVGQSIARQRAEEAEQERGKAVDLLDRPFQYLDDDEADLLKQEVRRLVAQLRSKAALRRKRAKSGSLDAKKTLRANLRYGGVPIELQYKHRHLKPKLVLICDLSTSMRNTVTFLLRIIYEMQDQVSSTHSFGFVGDLGSISEDFAEHPPDKAVEVVLARPDLQPGYYSTDLGNSLNTLMQQYAHTIDGRTTVIFVGDGRNNYRDPRLDLMEQIFRRSKRVVWFNPEHPHEWHNGDSDMPAYLPLSHAVHRVSSMNELTRAVDKLFDG